jgi:hypothetical protein
VKKKKESLETLFYASEFVHSNDMMFTTFEMAMFALGDNLSCQSDIYIQQQLRLRVLNISPNVLKFVPKLS